MSTLLSVVSHGTDRDSQKPSQCSDERECGVSEGRHVKAE